MRILQRKVESVNTCSSITRFLFVSIGSGGNRGGPDGIRSCQQIKPYDLQLVFIVRQIITDINTNQLRPASRVALIYVSDLYL